MADKRFGVKELIVLGSGTPTISTISSPGDLNLNANNIGINSTQPTVELDVNGKVALGSSVYDSNGSTGTSGQVLSSVPGVGVSWTDQTGGSGGSGGSSDPVGTIVAWAGSVASIPSEYQLCDGTSAQTSELVAITGANVPDLRSRFIVGAHDVSGTGTWPNVGVGSTGGSANAILVSHNHGAGTYSAQSNGIHNHSVGSGADRFQTQNSSDVNNSPDGHTSDDGDQGDFLEGFAANTNNNGSHTHTISGSSATVGKDNTGANSTSQTGTNANLPPYYALCYIIKHTATGGGTTTKIAILQDKKTSGTDGGTFTSGAWQDRTLNTETDPESIVGGIPNIFILQAGNYKINWSAPAHAVDSHQSKLLYANNISFTSSSEVLGSSEACHDPLLEGNNNIQTRSFGETILTLTQATFLKIQHRCTDTKSNTGFGVPSNFGVDEVYTQVVIQDLSSGGGSGTLTNIDVKQYADENTPRTEYGCSNPIEVTVNAGITTIGIGSTSNAFGKRYIGPTEPTVDVCDGDIWFDTTSTSGGPYASGQIIKTGTYSTGWGVGNSTVISSTTYTDIKLSGTNQTAHNITRNSIGTFDWGSPEALMFDKISNNSDLEVTVYFPTYLSNNSNPENGSGIRCFGRWNQNQMADHNGATVYAPLSSQNSGPYNTWNAHGYGGNAAGAIIYSWNTREAEMGFSFYNPTHPYAPEYKFWDKTGPIELKFQAALYSANGTLYIGSYPIDPQFNDYWTMIGKVIVREIAR